MKWVIRYSAVLKTPGGERLLDLPAGTRIQPTGEVRTTLYNKLPIEWTEITITFATKTWRGWIYSPLLEDYAEERPLVVAIEHQTPNPQDAEQYVSYRGEMQFNFCGQLCCCYLTGDSLETLLAKWEKGSSTAYKSAFVDNVSQPTGVYHLESILKLYGYPVPLMTYSAGLRDPLLGQALISPARMAAMLKTHRAIVGVFISTASGGDLRAFGVSHWVVLESCTPDGAGHGWVELYNPFVNRRQRYSWQDYIASARTLGAWVKR
jgi:hypothetical protein